MREGLLGAIIAGLVLVLPGGAAGGLDVEGDDRAVWSFSLAAGYDTYIHTFPLATEDTTETVSEMAAVLALEGRSPRRRVHRWSVRPELSVGTELLRGRLDFDYQYRPDSTTTVFRLDGLGLARLYNQGTEYTLTSDAAEGRTAARLFLGPAGRLAGEARLFGNVLHFTRPSELEIGYHELGGGLFVRSGQAAASHFVAGARLARRVYPDSVAISRTLTAGEFEYETSALAATGLRLFHRSERRLIQDETVRPSAWVHWSELEWFLPVGSLTLTGELQSEAWGYSEERSAYFDSWLLGGAVMLRGGGPFSPGWQVGLAGENLAANDSPEAYRQGGVRAGLEMYGTRFIGSLTVEYGRRNYLEEDPAAAPAANAAGEVGLELTDGITTYYSDFNYWQLWLMATISLGDNFSWDCLANYQPEKHTEQSDDSSVAFFSLRLVWRP